MSTQTVTIPEVQLSFEQLLGAIRQLEPTAKAKIAQVLLNDEMDERFGQLIERLANKLSAADITDEEINAEVQAVRRQKR